MAFRKHVMITVALLAVAFAVVGCNETSVTEPVPTAEAPILAPSNVSVSILSNGDVSISWDANTQTHLRGYNVYRLDRDSSSITRLNSAEITATNYSDRTAENLHEYEYSVTSVSAKGAESPATAVALTYIVTNNQNTKKRWREDD